MSEPAEQITLQQSALDETHRRKGATMTERDGWEVPAHYGNVSAEYEAVRGGKSAGLFDLSSRGRVEVSGAEAVMFLNGLVTNDVKTLRPGEWMAAAFPNVQGRLLAHARVVNQGDNKFLFDTETATRTVVLKTLERFTLAGDFHVADRTEETALLSVQGARAEEIVGAVFGAEAARQTTRGRALETSRQGADVTLMRATHTAEDGFDIFVKTESAEATWEALSEAGARPCGFEALEILRVEASVPRYGVDVNEGNVVLEAAQDDSVSFTKGCYVGQEIIARIHWRGHVAKRLAGLIFDEGETTPPPPTGSEVRASDGKLIGRITSSVFSPRLARAVALGVLKYDYLKPDTQVRVVFAEGVERAARVAALPFVRGSWLAAGAEETETG